MPKTKPKIKDNRNKMSFALNYMKGLKDEDTYYNAEETFRYRILIPQKQIADLTLKLEYNGLSRKEFFYTLIMMYLDDDEDMKRVVKKAQDFVYEYYKNNVSYNWKYFNNNRAKRSKQKREEFEKHKREEEIRLGLSEEEAEGIFDILASEEEILRKHEDIRDYFEDIKE